MKKIAINGTMLSENPSGIGIYGINIINGLNDYFKKKEINLSVFSPSSFGLSKEIKIIPVPHIIKSRQYKLVAALFRFFWNQISYFKLKGNFDLVFCITAQGNFFLKNQVMVVHDLLSLKMKGLTRFQRVYFRYFLPSLLKKTRNIITVSEATKLDIISYLGVDENKIHVVPCGYNNELYYPDFNYNPLLIEKYGLKNYFLAVGPSYPHKNFERLIQAYSELDKNKRDQNPLVIVGGIADYIETLKKFILDLDADLNIVFLGYIPLNELPVFYRNAQALIFPSLFEGFGLPPLEAMASGCPVICSGTSSMPEVCGNAAIYFDPFNYLEIKDGLNKILDDKVYREGLIEKGLVQAKRFSWTLASEQIGEILINSI